MSITAASNQKEKVLCPAGTFIARCYGIWDCGSSNETFKGVSKLQHKLMFIFEIPSKTHTWDESKGAQPHSISVSYNIYMNEQANLRQTVESWTGIKFNTQKEANEFDFVSLVGKPATITVQHATSKTSGNSYANIVSITPPMEGMNIPAQVNANFIFDFSDNFDTFSKLPDYFQKKIAMTEEYTVASNKHNQAPPTKGEYRTAEDAF